MWMFITSSYPKASRYPNLTLQRVTTIGRKRPLYFFDDGADNGPVRGASTFILQFPTRHVAVTADHVMAQYLTARETDPRTVCQIGECQVWPERSLIARSAKLDIATFDIDPASLPSMGALAFDCRHVWPAPEVQVGDTLTLAGYLDNQRTQIARGHYEMTAWGAHGIADAVSEREIVTIYDPTTTLAANNEIAKPPLGFNMSGCSGGPAIVIKDVNGLMRWFPAGLIYRGPDGQAQGEFASFDRIYVRKLHFIKQDGYIVEPESGWLPQ